QDSGAAVGADAARSAVRRRPLEGRAVADHDLGNAVARDVADRRARGDVRGQLHRPTGGGTPAAGAVALDDVELAVAQAEDDLLEPGREAEVRRRELAEDVVGETRALVRERQRKAALVGRHERLLSEGGGRERGEESRRERGAAPRAERRGIPWFRHAWLAPICRWEPPRSGGSVPLWTAPATEWNDRGRDNPRQCASCAGSKTGGDHLCAQLARIGRAGDHVLRPPGAPAFEDHPHSTPGSEAAEKPLHVHGVLAEAVLRELQ